MNLNDRDRRAVILCGGFLLLAGVIQFGLMPWIGSWREARERIAVARAELVELELQVQRVSAQHQRLGEVVGTAFGKPLPTLAEAHVQATKTQALLGAKGFQPTSVRPQPVQPVREVPGVSLMPVRLEGQGQFMQIPAAIAAVYEADQLLLIQRLTLSPMKQRPDLFDVSMTLATPVRSEVRP